MPNVGDTRILADHTSQYWDGTRWVRQGGAYTPTPRPAGTQSIPSSSYTPTIGGTTTAGGDPNDPFAGMTPQEILKWIQENSDSFGGGSAPAFGSTQAGMQYAAELQASADQRQLDGQKILQQLGFDFQNMDREDQQTFAATQALLNQAFQTSERIGAQEFQLGRDQFQAELQERLQGLGFDHDIAMQAAQQTFTALESQKVRDFQAEQGALDRGLTREQMAQTAALTREQMAATAADNAASRALQERLTLAGFEHATAERIASQTFQAAENEQERAFKLALQREGFDHDTSERLAGQLFTAEQAAMDRQLQKSLQESQQAFSAEEARKEREARLGLQKDQQAFEKEQREAELKYERQKTYVDMMGKDPVRAVLFAMGIGKDAENFNTQWGAGEITQAPLAGAEQSKMAVEKALTGTLGKPVTVGEEGVKGLGTVEQAARAFQKGGGDVKTLLSSAFGVGNVETGGTTGEEVARRIQEVTPTGVLPSVGR